MCARRPGYRLFRCAGIQWRLRGGGEARSVNWVIATLQELLGREAHVNHIAPRPGDQVHTRANIDKARAEPTKKIDRLGREAAQEL